jgi:hypothetical protein
MRMKRSMSFESEASVRMMLDENRSRYRNFNRFGDLHTSLRGARRGVMSTLALALASACVVFVATILDTYSW